MSFDTCAGKNLATAALVRLAAIAVLLLLASPAAASPPKSERLAIAVNEPFGWSEKIIAASLYVGVSRHHAIRANVAHYATPGAHLQDVITAINGADNHEVERRGGYLDLGAGWQWYPRALWRGPTVELGALWRADHTLRDDPADTSAVNEVHRDATVFAARALVGWSWLFEDRLIVSVAAGASLGYARGIETTTYDDDTRRMSETHAAPAAVAAVESYLRLGWSF